jgi:hypothetical protein
MLKGVSMKYLPLLFLVALVGCSSNPPQPTPDTVFSEPPHLWSGQKVVGQTPDSCAANGVKILKALSFVSVVKNDSYVYGTLMANRAAIKCIPNGEETFVYAAVAGPDVKQVERLRNEIVWRL